MIRCTRKSTNGYNNYTQAPGMFYYEHFKLSWVPLLVYVTAYEYFLLRCAWAQDVAERNRAL